MWDQDSYKVYCLFITECLIEGQIYYQYPECAPCNVTCENPAPPCYPICRSGCACPLGQVIKDGSKCVNKSECSPGDINYYMSGIKANNVDSELLFTLKNMQYIHITVYLHEFYRLLTTACPIKGQIYYPECSPCNVTCENLHPPCYQICIPGCACPPGKVIKNGRRCVKPEKCEKEGDFKCLSLHLYHSLCVCDW